MFKSIPDFSGVITVFSNAGYIPIFLITGGKTLLIKYLFKNYVF